MTGAAHMYGQQVKVASKSLLVVEDDPVLLVELRDILEDAGYRVRTAANGEAALAEMRSIRPDLILSDTSMPIMNGFEFLETVRSRPGGKAIPFIFITTSSSDEDRTTGRSMGINDYITKPLARQEVLEVVNERLQGGEEYAVSQITKENDRTTLLVVEDDMAMLVALRDILEGAGYSVRTAAHGEAALQAYRESRPALILSDISMPVMDGIELFEAVRKEHGGTTVPFIFLTARGTREDVLTGMSLGADDYISKPITSHELLRAVSARLKRSGELMLAQLKVAYKASLLALANAIEARDQYTHDHVMRISAYARAIAKELAWDTARCEILEFGAILHDIGKLDVPISILLKPGRLTPEEMEQMRRHPVHGTHMIAGIEYLAPAVPIILHHHEAWDGSGYPDGLKGMDIPAGARLLAVVDSFDAMTSSRPYRPAILPEAAYDEICSLAGHQYDPTMVEAFKRCWERGEIEKILREPVDNIVNEKEMSR
jgi:putative two-component system response regulator